MVSQTSLLQKQRLSPQRERVAIQTINATVCNFYVLGKTQTQSSIIRSITCVTRLTSRCIVTTTNLSAETSDEYSEHSSAVWNACNCLGLASSGERTSIALSVRLLLCSQQMLSCSESKGSGTPSGFHFHTANSSQHSCIPSLYQPKSFTSLSLTSAVCPCHLPLCTGSALFHPSIECHPALPLSIFPLLRH